MTRPLIPRSKRALASCLSRLPVSSRILGPPRGIHDTALGAIHESHPAMGQVLVERETLQYIQSPARTVEAETPFFQGRRELLHPYAAVFKRGRVYGNEGITILPDDRVAMDLVPRYYVDKKYRQIGGPRVLRRLKLPRLQKVDGCVVNLALGESRNYSHWTFQNMTRLALLQSAGVEADHYYVDVSQSFQVNFLEIMGVPRDKVIPAKQGMHLEAAQLIVVGGCAFNQVPHPELLREVRESVLARGGVPATRKLFISRADASYRKVCNEEEVMAYLGPRGFERVTMSGLTVHEQAHLLQEASVVISPHGANMTNVMYCQPGTHVLEVFQPRWMDSGFTAACDQMHLRYFYGLGEECDHGGRLPDHPGMAPCFRFRIDRLERFMQIVERQSWRQKPHVGYSRVLNRHVQQDGRDH